jgi:hypothetical protein
MKKFYYIIGAVATAAAIFAIIAVMLKKLKVSLCIEGLDDESILDDVTEEDITLSFDDEELEEEPEIETVISDEE